MDRTDSMVQMEAPATNSETVDVVVVGGGIAGLVAAYRIVRDQPDATVVVLEASDRVGGKIASATIAGANVDTGPDAFLARVPGGVELAHELGLEDSLVAPATGQAYVWSRGHLRALPKGLVLGVPSDLRALRQSKIVSNAALLRALFGFIPRQRIHADDVSVADGIGAHLGREIVDRLVDPLLGGINASDCDRLSLASAAPNLDAAARSRSLVRELRRSNAAQSRGEIGSETTPDERPVFLTPSTGVKSLTSALATTLGRRIRLGHVVDSIDRAMRADHGGSPLWSIRTTQSLSSQSSADAPLFARAVVLAIPAAKAAPLVRNTSGTAAAELASIRTSSVALTLLAYRAADVDLPPGSGMLVPRVEGRLMTASSWWNHKWPHLSTPGHVLLRASAGRDGDARFLDLSDDALVDRLHAELSMMLALRARPAEVIVTRWIDGFPQYDVGHAARVTRIDDALAGECPGIVVAGASYRGIGIPACIRSGWRAAEQTISTLRSDGGPLAGS